MHAKGNYSTIILTLALLAILFVGLSSVKANMPVENSWMTKAPMSVARSDLGVATVNGKIYAIGGSTQQSTGMDSNGGVVDTNEEYDPLTNAWGFEAEMMTPREGFATAVLDNSIYCIGGLNGYGAESAVSEVYYPANNSWSTKASLPTAEEGMQANVINGKIYLIGINSYLSGINSTITYVYDPINDSWTTKAPMPNKPSGLPTSCVLDGKIYVISSYLTQIYNPLNDTWSTVTPLPVPMTYPVSVAITGTYAPKYIYVFYENSLEIYNPQTDSWMPGGSLPMTIVNPEIQGVKVLTDREFYSVIVLNDTIYTIGGRTITYPSSSTYSPYQPGNMIEDATNDWYIPIGYGTVSPTISIVAPENLTYNVTSVPLIFTINKQVNWIGYSLDGKQNVTITGNTTITNLMGGWHRIAIYANDTFGHIGTSGTSNFSIVITSSVKPKIFPTGLIIAVSIVIIVIAISVLYYRKNHRILTRV
jgi:hypothetical protein